jgi:hypothetical protein
MTEHLKNKRFIPYKIVKRKSNKINKDTKIFSAVLIIIIFILFPICIQSLEKKEDLNSQIKPVFQNEIKLTKDSILKYIELADYIEEADINDKQGIVIVKGNQNLEALTLRSDIVIKSLEYLGEDKYKLTVVRSTSYEVKNN